jgi:predicted membrane protein
VTSIPPRSPVRDVVLGGLFIGLALVLPMLFHSIGAGPVFLPMHIPVFLAGFAVSPWAAISVGLLSPLLSSVLTGMPPLAPPIAQGMMVELAVYGLATAWLYRYTRRVVLSWAVSAVLGRLAYGLFGALILPLFGFKGVPLLYPVSVGLITGLPGIAVQAVLVPVVVYATQRVKPRARAK